MARAAWSFNFSRSQLRHPNNRHTNAKTSLRSLSTPVISVADFIATLSSDIVNGCPSWLPYEAQSTA